MYWMSLVMDGIGERISISPIGAAVLVGPVLLICGPIRVLIGYGYHAKFGSILPLLGCVVLAVYMGYGVSGLFSMSWPDAKPFLPVFGS